MHPYAFTRQFTTAFGKYNHFVEQSFIILVTEICQIVRSIGILS